jgi:hypothetical protein
MPDPVDPNTDYEAGLADGTSSPSDIPASDVDTAPAPVDPAVNPEAGSGEQPAVPVKDVQTAPEDLPADTPGLGFTANASGLISKSQTSASQDPLSAAITNATGVANGGTFSGALFGLDAAGAAAGATVGQVFSAQNQQNYTNLSQQPLNNDWRVTLRLAPGSNYLYNAGNAGLLSPLKVTNGVIFPYTPSISTSYKANYSAYDLTHSNYRGYFYQNSYVDAINLTATFTAQSTADASYVLAVIHFFRSVTKMFYGQDAQRGSPPPLVFLSGLGDYQFNNHPCLVQQFNYTLPPDVDYISSGAPNILGLNLQPLQNLYSTTLNAISPTATRLAAAFLPPGAQNALPAPLQGLLSNPTYVPSKIDISLTLLPVQSRSQVSQTFSLRDFANGSLIKKGFW